MAKYVIEDITLTNIANSIRAKNGETVQYTPEEMVDAIKGIQTGSAIIINIDSSSTVYIQNQETNEIKNATENNGTWTFSNCDVGTWKIYCSLNGNSITEELIIQEYPRQVEYVLNLKYAKIYGIRRDITQSSPLWERIDDAFGFTATASVGTSAGSSSFDNCYPWSGIAREILVDTNDIMVKIPKFYYQRYREGNIEYIKIADIAVSGFELHPAFNHSSIEADYIYVGAYKTSINNKSASKVTIQTSQTRATMRTNAKNKGNGWGIIDASTLSAIQMLMLVEFATNDMQTAIGRGHCDGNNAPIKTGSCDNVANLTGIPVGTNGKVDVVWRGIEGFWGNVWEFVDGVNWNEGTYYVCNDPSNYADDTATDYTQLSFDGATNWSQSYITEKGLDTGVNEHVMLPVAAVSGSESTFDCDACWSSTGWRIFICGGDYNIGSGCGLFSANLNSNSSRTATYIGSRLLYIPS